MSQSVYLIMPVRQADEAMAARCREYLSLLEARGYTVHFPPRDAPQDDPTGQQICEMHRRAMVAADEVHVIWDVNSKGSHFDLGMAYALHKRIVAVALVHADSSEKSYWKAVICARASHTN